MVWGLTLCNPLQQYYNCNHLILSICKSHLSAFYNSMSKNVSFVDLNILTSSIANRKKGWSPQSRLVSITTTTTAYRGWRDGPLSKQCATCCWGAADWTQPHLRTQGHIIGTYQYLWWLLHKITSFSFWRAVTFSHRVGLFE